jgi:hypothetical protein
MNHDGIRPVRRERLTVLAEITFGNCSNRQGPIEKGIKTFNPEPPTPV